MHLRSKRDVCHGREQRKRCLPLINKYPRVQNQIQQLEAEGDARQVAVLLTELDAYLAAYPGSMPQPEFMCGSGDDSDFQFIQVMAAANETRPIEITSVEDYVLQCMIVRVVKAEPEMSAHAAVKPEQL